MPTMPPDYDRRANPSNAAFPSSTAQCAYPVSTGQRRFGRGHVPIWSDNGSTDRPDPTPAVRRAVHLHSLLKRFADPQAARCWMTASSLLVESTDPATPDIVIAISPEHLMYLVDQLCCASPVLSSSVRRNSSRKLQTANASVQRYRRDPARRHKPVPLRIPTSIEPLGQMRCPRSFRNHEYDVVTTVNAEIARPAAKHSFHMRDSSDLQKQSPQ